MNFQMIHSFMMFVYLFVYLFVFLQASHALARKQLDPKDYCKHIQYFLTLLIANFSSLVSSAKILTNLAAPKGKYLTP